MKWYQAIIIGSGIVGILIYFFLNFALRLQIFGVLTQAEEVAAEVKMLKAITLLCILMGVLAVAWYLLFPKHTGKFRTNATLIYFIPFFLEGCKWTFALIIALYYAHQYQ
jgi:hypothetical protein